MPTVETTREGASPLGAAEQRLNLSAEERRALIRLLRHTVDKDPFPLSVRLGILEAILAELDPLPPRPVDAPRARRSRR